VGAFRRQADLAAVAPEERDPQVFSSDWICMLAALVVTRGRRRRG